MRFWRRGDKLRGGNGEKGRRVGVACISAECEDHITVKPYLGSLIGKLLHASSGLMLLRPNSFRTRLSTVCGWAVAAERVRAIEPTCK